MGGQYRPPQPNAAMGTPLQASVGFDRFPLGPPPKLDARNAAAETLAAYLGQVVFVVDGRKADDSKFRLNEVLANWPEAEVQLDYPAASIDGEAAPYEAHNFVPTMLEDTFNCYGEGLVLWKTGELILDFQVDFWTNTEADRQAISAGLPRIFNLTEIRSGVLLAGHPDYFGRAVRCTLMDTDRADESDTTFDRERRLRVMVRSEIDVVHLRQVSLLHPDVIITVQE